MNSTEVSGILEFIRETERLKNIFRTAWTSGGERENVASHTWRLCLMALVFEQSFPGIDFGRLLKICIIHDLGEAIHGDIPAIHQDAANPKADSERMDLLTLVEPLPQAIKDEIVGLWDEYEAAETDEARIAKALDKLETLLQHNQGANPADFDYLFNLDYGKKHTDAIPLVAEIRKIVDEDTRRNAVNAD